LSANNAKDAKKTIYKVVCNIIAWISSDLI